MTHETLPWRDQDLVFVGHCLDVLRTLPDESVHCIITSIPYWGLRSYGTEPQIWGGDPVHAHEFRQVHPPGYRSSDSKPGPLQHEGNTGRDRLTSGLCLCGAWRGELGLEPSPEMFVEHIVEIFREARRVLRSDGTLWLNVGDSYFGTGYSQKDTGKAAYGPDQWPQYRCGSHGILKPKDLCLIPARLALALQADGWWVRSEIEWCKLSAMPESIEDRPTNAHEKIWLLSKSRRYFYDAQAVKEKAVSSHVSGNGFERPCQISRGGRGSDPQLESTDGRNMRNYWLLGPENFPGAHFATFPTEVPRRAILAGTSAHGCCSECGAPWRRVVKPTEAYAKHLGKDWADDAADSAEGRGHFEMGDGRRATQRRVKRKAASLTAEYETVGWEPTCKHTEATVVPCTVLDPFSGAGTSGLVARRHGRAYVGIELNPKYAEISRVRLEGEPNLFNSRHLEVTQRLELEASA